MELSIFIPGFYSKTMEKWRWVFLSYFTLLLLSVAIMSMLVKIDLAISQQTKVFLAILSIFSMTFPLVVELIRSKIRSAYFLDYLKCYRDKMSSICSTVLKTVLTDDGKESKYILRLRDDYTSKFKDGAVWNKGDFLIRSWKRCSRVLDNERYNSLLRIVEHLKSWNSKCSVFYVPIDLNKLDSEEDLFKLEFKIKRRLNWALT